ncbi:PREDICTED: uncharacterized protein LOC109338575 [Lupinus angustifolius]|uniref:uncharacterized protein LOC109338575 n=1 Tax=Lupinus angustifolius TaxID=3871 RepID=UPI00092EBEB3|nr:PREDICTED: uncharacterized protein LOC109338575 [Lupinus angustifolius]
MTDLGELSYFLGIEFKRTKQGIFMHQSKYTTNILDKFQMMNCITVVTPIEAGVGLCQGGTYQEVEKTKYRQMIGSFRYVCNSRPGIAYGVGLVSIFMESPKQSHLCAVKRLLRYLRGTIGYGIMYPTNSNCSDKSDRKSTTGNVHVSWCSKKQDVVALSSCEAEYITTNMSTCQVVWLDGLMKELRMKIEEKMQLMMDNKSTIKLAMNSWLMEEGNT